MDDEEEFGDFEADSAANKGAEFFGKQNPIERAAIAALKKQKATWQTDGLGIRGPANVVSNATANLVWPSSNVSRRTNPEIDQGGSDVAAEVPTEPAP
jgi:hypothetical protein